MQWFKCVIPVVCVTSDCLLELLCEGRTVDVMGVMLC
jgi:hypothetical protein